MKSSQNLAFGLHEQARLVKLRKGDHTTQNVFLDTTENGPFNVAALAEQHLTAGCAAKAHGRFSMNSAPNRS